MVYKLRAVSRSSRRKQRQENRKKKAADAASSAEMPDPPADNTPAAKKTGSASRPAEPAPRATLWRWVERIATAVAFFSLGFAIPALTSAPHATIILEPNDPFSSQFELKNESALGMTNVDLACGLDVDYKRVEIGGNVLEGIDFRNMFLPGSSRYIPQLDKGSSASTTCTNPTGVYQPPNEADAFALVTRAEYTYCFGLYRHAYYCSFAPVFRKGKLIKWEQSVCQNQSALFFRRLPNRDLPRIANPSK
jgi:hypothetical protein